MVGLLCGYCVTRMDDGDDGGAEGRELPSPKNACVIIIESAWPLLGLPADNFDLIVVVELLPNFHPPPEPSGGAVVGGGGGRAAGCQRETCAESQRESIET